METFSNQNLHKTIDINRASASENTKINKKSHSFKFFARFAIMPCMLLTLGLVLGSISTGFSLNLQSNGNFSLSSLGKSINLSKLFATQTAKAADLPANTLAATGTQNRTSNFFNTGVLRNQITEITFVTHLNNNRCADSENQTYAGVGANSESVIICTTKVAPFIVRFYGEGGVTANPDSSYAFSYLGDHLGSNSGDPDVDYMYLDFSNYDGSTATNMNHMFESLSNETVYSENGSHYFDLLNFEAGFGSNATNMSWMFGHVGNGCANLTDFEMDKFPAGFGSKATDTSNMFENLGNGSTSLTNFESHSFPYGFGNNSDNYRRMFANYMNGANASLDQNIVDLSQSSFKNIYNSQSASSVFKNAFNGSASSFVYASSKANSDQFSYDMQSANLKLKYAPSNPTTSSTVITPNPREASVDFDPVGNSDANMIQPDGYSCYISGTKSGNSFINYEPCSLGERSTQVFALEKEHFSIVSLQEDKEYSLSIRTKYNNNSESINPSYITFRTQKQPYTLSFEANGGTGSQMEKKTVYTDTPITLPKDTYKPSSEDRLFACWSTDEDYNPKDCYSSKTDKWNDQSSWTLTETKDTVLYAIWDTSYLLQFNANGATGSIKPIRLIYNETTKLPSANPFTNPGKYYSFGCWAEHKDFNSKDCDTQNSDKWNDQSEYTLSREKDTVLYAIWDKSYSLTFDPNGGEGTMKSMVLKGGESKKLEKNTFTHANKDLHFACWSINPDLSTCNGFGYYNDQENYELQNPKDEVLYAVWQKNPIKKVSVSFDLNGGTLSHKYNSQLIEENSYAIKPPNPKKENCYFGGWFIEKTPSSDEKSFDFNKTKIKDDLTLHALWIKVAKLIPANTTFKSTVYLVKDSLAKIKLTAYPDFNENLGKYDFDTKISIDNKKIIKYAKIKDKVQTNTPISIQVNAGSVGTTKLRVSVGSKKYAFNVVVLKKVDSKISQISIKQIATNGPNKDTLITNIGKTTFLSLAIKDKRPFDAIPEFKILNSISKKVVSIDSSGRLIPLQAGIAKAQVKVNNKIYKFFIKVGQVNISKITVSKLTDKLNKQIKSITVNKGKPTWVNIKAAAKISYLAKEKLTITYSKKSTITVYEHQQKAILVYPNSIVPMEIKRLKKGTVTLTLTASNGKSVKILVK